MIGVPIVTASLCFWASQRTSSNPNKSAFQTHRAPSMSNSSIVNARKDNDDKTGASIDEVCHEIRSFQTPADRFFQANKKIPLPSVSHAKLEDLINPEESNKSESRNGNILVIGDVHGCYEELTELHAKARKENNSKDFSQVILVGDLCNKGPESAKVIRHTRVTPGWFAVRGNHDDGALAAALGDEERLQSKTYQWVVQNGEVSDHHEDVCCENKTGVENSDEGVCIKTRLRKSSALSDDDVHWLSQLPYTILIPGEYLGEDKDTLIVHAGLIPDNELEDQQIKTMTTIRDLISCCEEKGNFSHYEYHSSKNGESAKIVNMSGAEEDDKNARVSCDEAVTWASAWRGPQKVIFGHDARRKLQVHDWATGLDTGAVYGGELTGIILPERKLVSVKSKEYSPI
eukprot:CAMPEP_0172369338 /NCGR_PEP_ID=MMETSP1060-20121228/32197_1 /TAXON_ID=37318 /ORGANISM="Pseudo-nitzschia pungens, Strain cf. cingulata" /LENGTH=401 /DNA_ID=CAMNT_0013094227 /DNA_START=224 /DNA_END=1426 /DNA_ORIENTATION=+